ncbi:MAG TPA: PIN domain-containing protein, partial [Burkholderiaceae bacterium]|nr:PIN domain-containing protein [Burkholderiaceae bacterium]
AYGACKSSQRAAVMQILREFIVLIPVLPMSAQAGTAYGEIRATLESDGTPIGNNDLWIAAQARAAGLTLVTNHQREFTRVPGLEVHNWA